MPGDYGPGGKWIHDRAHRIMREGETKDEYGKKQGKSIAYAIATQQAHALKKSPKDFRTSAGVREAKMKYDEPRRVYQKTAAAPVLVLPAVGAGLGALSGARHHEAGKGAVRGAATGLGVAGGSLLGTAGASLLGAGLARRGAIKTMGGAIAFPVTGALAGGIGGGILGHRLIRKAVPYEHEKKAMITGFFDELDKIAAAKKRKEKASQMDMPGAAGAMGGPQAAPPPPPPPTPPQTPAGGMGGMGMGGSM